MRWYSWLRNFWGAPAPTHRRPAARVGTGSSTVLAPGPAPFRLTYGVESTVGNYREHNEDNYFVPGRPSLGAPDGPNPAAGGGRGGDSTAEIEVYAGVPPNGPGGPGPEASLPEPLRGLFVVADGMGGQQAGEKASAMAVELIPKELANRLAPAVDDKEGITQALRKAVAAANDQILALSTLGPDYQHMGTTVVLTLFRGPNAYVAGIGDSRAYRLRDGKLEQLTRDHSLARALEEAGTIKPEEVESHKFNHVLYNYLGSRDAREGPELVRVLDLRPGDRFLMASDGLTGVVKDDEIAALLGAGSDPQQTAQELVNRALINNSKDNVTSAVIHVD